MDHEQTRGYQLTSSQLYSYPDCRRISRLQSAHYVASEADCRVRNTVLCTLAFCERTNHSLETKQTSREELFLAIDPPTGLGLGVQE